MLYFDDPQQKHLYLTILLPSSHRNKRSGMFHSVALILSLGFLQHVIYIHTALLSLEGDCIVRNWSINVQNFICKYLKILLHFPLLSLQHTPKAAWVIVKNHHNIRDAPIQPFTSDTDTVKNWDVRNAGGPHLAISNFSAPFFISRVFNTQQLL